jgi:hypothetical protein
VLRTPGVLYQELADGWISNLYNIKVVNKTFGELPIELKLISPAGKLELVGGKLVAPAGNLCETSFFVKLPRKTVRFSNTPITIAVESDGKELSRVRTSFLGPMQQGGSKK